MADDDIYTELAACITQVPYAAVTSGSRAQAKHGFWQAFRRVAELPENKPFYALLEGLHELHQAGAPADDRNSLD